jgi:outer membrane protein assembly factor BamA
MVVKLTKSNEISEYNGIKTVQLSNGPSFFAFLNYLFINTSNLNISNDEFNQVIEHEKSHILQRHTIDNLLMELAILVCWFNPVLRVMKRELNNVHEFYADQKASTLKSNIVSYSKLILKLAFNKDSNFLTHQFSMNNIKKRIIMLNKIKDRKSVILRYLMIVPCLTILLATFSFKQKAQVRENYVAQDSLQQIIENIFWKGNKLYSDEYLTEYLGLKKGDQFDEKTVMGNLDHKPLKGDLTSLFMDRGYLMFDINLKKEIDDSHIDLTFEINEGEIYTINKVFVTGNSKVPSKEILKMTDIKKDQLFNRSKLASSQQKIIESGIFDPEKVIAYPIPHLDDGIVDIEFKVVEL